MIHDQRVAIGVDDLTVPEPRLEERRLGNVSAGLSKLCFENLCRYTELLSGLLRRQAFVEQDRGLTPAKLIQNGLPVFLRERGDIAQIKAGCRVKLTSHCADGLCLVIIASRFLHDNRNLRHARAGKGGHAVAAFVAYDCSVGVDPDERRLGFSGQTLGVQRASIFCDLLCGIAGIRRGLDELLRVNKRHRAF